MGYIIEKSIKSTIVFKDYDCDSVSFVPSNKNKKYIHVKEVKIIKEDMASTLIDKKLKYRLNKMINVVNNLLSVDENDADEGDYFIVLDDIARFKSIIDLEYRKHLTIDEYNRYVDSLYQMDQLIREKLARINYFEMINSQNNYNNYEMYEDEEDLRHGRGR